MIIQKPTKYIAISFDEEYGRSIWDTLVAKSEKEARDFVKHTRKHAIIVDILSVQELNSVLNKCIEMQTEQIEKMMLELMDNSGYLVNMEEY